MEGKTGFGQKIIVKHSEWNLGGAVLEIEPGKRTDMVFHLQTRKVLYVLLGKINVVVLTDGKMAKVEMKKGASFAVKEGLIYQLEAVEKAVVVEFLSHFDDTNPDVRCVSRGSVDAPVAPAANVVMTEEDKVVEAPVVNKVKTKKKKKK